MTLALRQAHLVQAARHAAALGQGGFACTGQAGGPPGGDRALAGHEKKVGLHTTPWRWCTAPQMLRRVALTGKEMRMSCSSYSCFDSCQRPVHQRWSQK